MSDVIVDIDVVCSSHPKKTLTASWNEIRKELEVEPCEDCIDEANSEGYDRGLIDGKVEIS